MKLVNGYYQFPGKCFFTGSSDVSEGVIDTGHNVDFEGHVYMRGALGKEIAGALGWIPPERYADLVNERDNLLREVDELKLRLERYVAFDELARLVADETAAA